MPQIGFVCCDGVKRLYSECIEHSKSCACPWSPPILEAMSQNVREDQEHLTVTELLGCPRATVLKKTKRYFESPETGWYKLRGSLIHHALIGVDSGAIVERRFTRQLPNAITISGQPDIIYPQESLMFDLKTAKFIPRVAFTTHAWQLNAYRWLVGQQFQILNLEILYATNERTARVQVELMDPTEVVDFLMRKSSAVEAGLRGALPERVDEDGQWQCGYCGFSGECFPKGIPKAQKVRAANKS